MYLHLILIRIQLVQHGIQHKKIYLLLLGFTHSIRLWAVSTKHSEEPSYSSALQNVMSSIFPFFICAFILCPNVLYVLLHSGKHLHISLLTSSDQPNCFKYSTVKTKPLQKLSPSVSWQWSSSPSPGHFTISVTFLCSLPVSSPHHLYTLCLSMSMSFSFLLELILTLIICSFLLHQPLLQQLIIDSISLLYTAFLLSEKSFMFSKITPYLCLPLSSAQRCISFSSYIISQSLSTSLMWFIECLLKSSLRRL